MGLALVGVSHHDVPLSLLDDISRAAPSLPRDLVDEPHAGVSGAVLLSTCNRVELYFDAEDTRRAADVVHEDVRQAARTRRGRRRRARTPDRHRCRASPVLGGRRPRVDGRRRGRGLRPGAPGADTGRAPTNHVVVPGAPLPGGCGHAQEGGAHRRVSAPQGARSPRLLSTSPSQTARAIAGPPGTPHRHRLVRPRRPRDADQAWRRRPDGLLEQRTREAFRREPRRHADHDRGAHHCTGEGGAGRLLQRRAAPHPRRGNAGHGHRAPRPAAARPRPGSDPGRRRRSTRPVGRAHHRPRVHLASRAGRAQRGHHPSAAHGQRGRREASGTKEAGRSADAVVIAHALARPCGHGARARAGQVPTDARARQLSSRSRSTDLVGELLHEPTIRAREFTREGLIDEFENAVHVVFGIDASMPPS